MTDYIGKYVKEFESGSKGSLALGSCGYDWGLSCGSYQLTLRWGNAINFLKKYFPNEAKNLYFNKKQDKTSKTWPGSSYCSSPAAVSTVWTNCYNKVGAEKFFEYEHQFMEDNYYKPIKAKVKDLIDLDSANRAFQECFWSWAIHRGVNGANKEFRACLGVYKPSHYKNEKLFDLIYDERYVNAPYNRYKKGYASGEREKLRSLLSIPAYGKTSNDSSVKTMKYKGYNKPLKCIMTNSTCYKGTREMSPVGVLWHSTGANNPNLKRYVQPSTNDENYKQLLEKLGKNTGNNSWNQVSIQAGVNAWIGKLANGQVASVQTLPWDYRPWGCGKGKKGTCNDGWIQFEICEDKLTDEKYFNEVYEEAIQLTAYLCKMCNINPKGNVVRNGVKIPTILCHADSYHLGFGSNHADVLHWFQKYGKTMNDVRNDVAALIGTPSVQTKPNNIIDEEEEEVTQEQFNKMMDTWIAEQAKKEPGAWSADAREWAERNGLINGNEQGQKMYKKILTREEFAAVLYRALHRNIVD